MTDLKKKTLSNFRELGRIGRIDDTDQDVEMKDLRND